MRFYAWLDHVCPRSFVLKAFLIAFVGTHIPLIVMVGYVLATADGPFPWATVLVLVWATVMGAAFTLAMLHQVLQPILSASRAAKDYHDSRAMPKLPRFYEDEAGILMREVQALIEFSEGALAESEKISLIDPLTGLRNRRGFEIAAERTRLTQQGGLLAIIDCDYFKAINDTFGHQVGDQVLRNVATTISRVTRRNDIAARFGGDEFIVLMSGEQIEVDAIAERLRNELSRIDVPGSPRAMQCSVGLAVLSPDGTIEDAIATADHALFAMKGKRDTGPAKWPVHAGVSRIA